jgi:hypothetical protein
MDVPSHERDCGRAHAVPITSHIHACKTA